jgi:hypothetical protein
MKKSILSLAMLFFMAVGIARADDHGNAVSQKVLSSFKEKFTGAENVSWNREKEYNKATFSFNNQILFAYFDTDGVLIATVRNILTDKLPINLLLPIKKDYNNFWVSELLEVDSDWSIAYYITLENDSKILTLRSDNGTDWELYKKIKKD